MDAAELVLAGHLAWFELLAGAGARVRRFDGGIAVVSGVQSNTDNGVAFDPVVGDLDALDAAIGWVRTSDVPASCLLASAPDAPTLERLGSSGLRADNDGNDMGRTLDDWRSGKRVPHGLEIVEVRSASELIDALAALGGDWYDADDRRSLAGISERIGFGDGSSLRHWVAAFDGTPVGMASSFLVGDTVVLERCGVAATHRRHGIATALTDARLVAAVLAGARRAVLSPSPDGYELHRHLGFTLAPSHANRWFHIDPR